MAFSFGDDEPEWATNDPFGDPDDDGDDGDDGDAHVAAGTTRPGAEHVLFLFDCAPAMYHEAYVPCRLDAFDGPRRIAPLDVAVAAGHRFLRTKIRDVAETAAGKRDAVGVLLYGCDPRRRAAPRGGTDGDAPSDGEDGEESDGSSEGEELPATHELLELAPPGVEQVLTLQECRLRGDRDQKRRDLGKEFSAGQGQGEGGGGEDEDAVCTLLQGLTAAQKIFANSKRVKAGSALSKQAPDSKAVWIFTNQDDPCRGNAHQRTRLLGSLRSDCRDAGIVLHVVPLPTPSRTGGAPVAFDQGRFYDALTRPGDRVAREDIVDADGGAVDVEAVVGHLNLGARKRRRFATVPLLLPGWRAREDRPAIMLDLYGMVQVRKKPAKVAVHQEKNTMTIKKTNLYNAETNDVVKPEDVHYFVDFCGRVSIPPTAISTIKRAANSQDQPALVVHGFRPTTQLPTTHLLDRSSLAVANDARASGSEKALHNLRLSMVKKRVFAVGELTVRATATSRMVAIVPGDDAAGGFVVTRLPFKEDVRTVPAADVGFADRRHAEAAKRLILKSSLNFEGGHFAHSLPENPLLKHFFGYLESVSLGKPQEEVEDDAKMDTERMLAAAGEEIAAFSLSLPEDDAPVQGQRKRKAGPPSAKPEVVKERISDEWKARYRHDELRGLKNDELKAFLKGQGERLAGNKGDLVDRVVRVIQAELFKE